MNSPAANSFTARASGGVKFFTNAGATTGVSLAAGGGSWASVSDRARKRNLRPVDPMRILRRVASLPLSSWSYRSQSVSIRHIGPMAQDFARAFAVGEDPRHITTIDADGVALAAIQGLYRENLAVKRKNAALEARLAALERAFSRIAK